MKTSPPSLRARRDTGTRAYWSRLFLKTAKTPYYRGKVFMRLGGFKANYFDVDTHKEYWISGPKRNGEDGLCGSRPTPIAAPIDDDVREEYWTTIRQRPDKKHQEDNIAGHMLKPAIFQRL